MSVVKNGRLLVLLDANETLMYRQYDPAKSKYGPPVVRPFLKEFFAKLSSEPKVDVGVWCGAMTMAQEAAILEILASGGVPTDSLKVVLRAFDVCQRKGAGRYFPGTTKLIYVKPVGLVNMLLPAYPRVLLVDNDPEKSDGVGPAGKRRWKNLPDEHMEVPPFRGQFMDNCLNPDGGASWVALHKRVSALRQLL